MAREKELRWEERVGRQLGRGPRGELLLVIFHDPQVLRHGQFFRMSR